MQRWSVEQANSWSKQQPWFFGANFTPSTAINQLEMWQAETFDPETIERELGYAQGIGMNIMRVYLHDLLWEHDRDGFIERIEKYLAIADAKGILSSVIYGPDQRTRITPDTRQVLFTIYAPPGIKKQTVRQHLVDIQSNVTLVASEAQTLELKVYGTE